MTQSSATRLSEFSSELADLVARCSPAVVAIRLRSGRSLSGIVWRPGQVVTAAEPLDEDPSPRVVSATATEHEAKFLGSDPGTDVALLRVEGLADEALPEGDPAALRAGQLALALGRSPEHGPIVTFGSVAVAGAQWHSQRGGRIDRLIRLDASLSRAAEGAAVLDLDARLLGMAVLGPRGTLLVIPTPTVARSAEQLLTKGRVVRGYLGIAMQPVRLPEPLGKLANTQVGLLVSGVDGQSGAAVGGVLLGDVIVAWNGEPVRDYRQVQRLLGPESVGSTVILGAVRGGALIDLRLTVGERPSSE